MVSVDDQTLYLLDISILWLECFLSFRKILNLNMFSSDFFVCLYFSLPIMKLYIFDTLFCVRYIMCVYVQHVLLRGYDTVRCVPYNIYICTVTILKCPSIPKVFSERAVQSSENIYNKFSCKKIFTHPSPPPAPKFSLHAQLINKK